MSSFPVYKGKNPLIPGADFLKNPYRFSIGPARDFGDFFRVPFLLKKIFFTSNLDVAKHVLQTNQKNYVKSIAYRNLGLALGNGLVTSEGDDWRRNRRLAQPAFYKTQLEGLYHSMVEVTTQYCEELTEKIKQEEEVDITKEMMAVTAEVVLRALFNTTNPATSSEIHRIVGEAQLYIVKRTVYPFLLPWMHLSGQHRKFVKDMKWFDEHLYALIEERRKDKTPSNDLLSMLIHSRYEDTGEPMADQQLRDEAITLFAAGHETSSNGLSWIFYLLSQHPEILDRLREEVDGVLGDRMPSFQDLRKLSYTMQVIQEGMRLYPPAFAVGREPLEDDEILGEKIPKGSVVFVSICGIHRDPKYWERPDDFFPAHFSPENEKKRPRMAYMPFGAGPRMCIGNHFALMEMQLLLAVLVRRFKFDLVSNVPVVPQPLITLKPKYGIGMRITKRVVAPSPTS